MSPTGRGGSTLRKHVMVILSLLGVVGCATNRQLVAKATAEQAWHQEAFEHKCLKPNTLCDACKTVINDGFWKIQAADNIVKKTQLFVLADSEKKDLKALIDALQSCP